VQAVVEPDILGLQDAEWIIVPSDLPCLQIERAAQQPSVSHIAAPAASWVDDFLSWTRCFHRPVAGHVRNGTGLPCPCTILHAWPMLTLMLLLV
jgi:hypothetical protein